jgi:hypothetical protein
LIAGATLANGTGERLDLTGRLAPAVKFVPELPESPGIDCFPHAAHELQIVIQVVPGIQYRSENFVALVQVAQISS